MRSTGDIRHFGRFYHWTSAASATARAIQENFASLDRKKKKLKNKIKRKENSRRCNSSGAVRQNDSEIHFRKRAVKKVGSPQSGISNRMYTRQRFSPRPKCAPDEIVYVTVYRERGNAARRAGRGPALPHQATLGVRLAPGPAARSAHYIQSPSHKGKPGVKRTAPPPPPSPSAALAMQTR